jgi:isopenicillin N synthase-like dioxygenase
VLLACALALALPLDFFATRTAARDLITLRMLHYPPVADAATPEDVHSRTGRVRAGEHTDFGAITLLFVDASGDAAAARGLQVRRPAADAAHGAAASEWLDIEPEPGTVVVNTGGLLAQWTNDAWVATAHRVVITPEALTSPRFSIALFVVDPDADVLVECLPPFCGPGRPAKYAPITSKAYLLAKLAEAQQRKEVVPQQQDNAVAAA